MATPTYYLLHVADPARSSGFYTELFGRPPVETSPTFVLFVLDGGIKVGLWSRQTGSRRPAALPALIEIGIALGTPADMDFGRSCMVTDPDGHRIRVFAISM